MKDIRNIKIKDLSVNEKAINSKLAHKMKKKVINLMF